ncbi:hypothetical protein BDV98DRAFT_302653 [Pterulicium gracile]|uniref:Uncharacterized protein n=1 Tax=Pterulicium gracile TaxID=1884261 RepID=A0A5C3Q6Q6_9AGAR|nr:hypothetical protein BDV98DRAFT_302653 [Pterula gracilis]
MRISWSAKSSVKSSSRRLPLFDHSVWMVGILICVSSSAFGTSTTVTMDDSSPRQPPGDSIVYEPANAWVGADEFDSSCRGEDTSTNRGGLVGVSVEEQRSWCEMLGRVNATMASENTWHAPRPRPQRPIHETNVSQSDTTTLKPWSGEDTPTVRVHFNGSFSCGSALIHRFEL